MAAKKGKGVGDAVAPERQRLNIRLTPEAYRRLGVHAVYCGTTPGKLVEKLVADHLKDLRVQVISHAYIDRQGVGIESNGVDLAAVV
jgi:hypothetical protein